MCPKMCAQKCVCIAVCVQKEGTRSLSFLAEGANKALCAPVDSVHCVCVFPYRRRRQRKELGWGSGKCASQRSWRWPSREEQTTSWKPIKCFLWQSFPVPSSHLCDFERLQLEIHLWNKNFFVIILFFPQQPFCQSCSFKSW